MSRAQLWSLLAAGLMAAGCVPSDEAEKADEDADSGSDAGAGDAGGGGDGGDGGDDTGGAPDTGEAPEYDYVVDQFQVTWTLGLVNGVQGDVPGVTEAVTVHFTNARRWRDDFTARRGQCMVVLDPALATPVDWYADVPGILSAWEFEDAGAAALGTSGDCPLADLSAVGGDPVAWLGGKRIGFGLAQPTEAASAAFADRFSDYEEVSASLLQGVILTDYNERLRYYDDQYVISYETDALGVVVDEAGDDVLLDARSQLFLMDGVFIGRPLDLAFPL